MDATCCIHRNNRLYEALIAVAQRYYTEKSYELALAWVSGAAKFAIFNHTGRYADGRIENIALQIGRKLEVPEDLRFPDYTLKSEAGAQNKRFRVLHLMTQVSRVGGHNSFLANWIKNDPDSLHTVVISDQEPGELPDWFRKVMRKAGASLLFLPIDSTLIHRAQILRKLAEEEADYIILHHYGHDVIPLVAFSEKSRTPVATFNHADHLFWLGSSITDALINFRSSLFEHNCTRRGLSINLLLPVPLRYIEVSLSREEARESLGLDSTQLMILSMGQHFKYVPYADRNFFEVATYLLDHFPQIELYIIGVKWDPKVEYLKQHPRLHYLGIVENPLKFQLAADLYLECFPEGSYTSLLETAALGVCVVPLPTTVPRYISCKEFGLKGLVKNEPDMEGYIERVIELIRTPEERFDLGSKLKTEISKHHTGPGWKAYLEKVYQSLKLLEHTPKEIASFPIIESIDDVETVRFQKGNQDKGPALLDWCWMHRPILNLSNLFNLFLCSIRVKDTSLCSIKYLRSWLGLFRAMRRCKLIPFL